MLKKELKMLIREISINDADLVFESLKSNTASIIANVFLEFKRHTNDFSIYPQDIYTIDEIADILYNLKTQINDVTDIFESDSQSVKLTNALINYFNTGF